MACRIARAWTFIVIVHFMVQIALQVVTLMDNQQAKAATSLCLARANVPTGVPIFQNGELSLCNGVPGHTNVTCIPLASVDNSIRYSTLTEVDTDPLTTFNLDQVLDVPVGGTHHYITGRCALSLEWMFVAFRNNAAEDIATICFQFWLLIISLLAVIQDSIPHLAVCIASHLLDVGWAGFRIRSTIQLKEDYYSVIVDAACQGEDMLGDWWDQRLDHAVPLFATNVVTLILLSALAVILFRWYARINFCRMGASPAVTRMYKIALSFSAFLQLGAFFTILAVGMWIDLLSCDVVSGLDGNVKSDQAGFFVLTVIFAPWIISGWWAIFREIKWAFVLFGVFHAFLLTLWPGMLASAIFRYVLKNWSFFACVSVTSYLFVVATAIMAVVCRMSFGRGLGHFLRVESELSSSGFPASFFSNDPAEKAPRDTLTSLDFDFLDAEKARKGSMDKDGCSMDIRPFTVESSKYSAHSISFGIKKNIPMPPVSAALPTTRDTSTAIVRALNRGIEKALPEVRVDPESRPSSYVSCTSNDGSKEFTSPIEKEKLQIRPPPEAHLPAPFKESRSRKQTPSLLTQATCISTASCSQVEVTHARKGLVLCARAKTVAMSTTPSIRASSPVDTVLPHENNPSVDFGTQGGFFPQQDAYGRI